MFNLFDIAYALETNVEIGGKKNYSNAFEYISNFFNWSIGIAASLAVAVLVYGAILYSTSGGDQSKINAAKEWIYGAISGVVLLLLARLIISLIGVK